MSTALYKLAALVRQISPSAQLLYLPKALAGDADAAAGLCRHLEDEHLTQLMPLLYEVRIPSPVFRFMLHRALVHSFDFRNTIKAAGGRQQFVEWCRYASFKLPDTLPDMVPIYRGTFGCSADAATGLHWSLWSPMAAWFALRRERRYPAPGKVLVLKAWVPKASLFLYSDAVGHQEVMPEAAPAEYEVSDFRWSIEYDERQAIEFFIQLGALKVKPERLREMRANPAMQSYLRAATVGTVGASVL